MTSSPLNGLPSSGSAGPAKKSKSKSNSKSQSKSTSNSSNVETTTPVNGTSVEAVKVVKKKSSPSSPSTSTTSSSTAHSKRHSKRHDMPRIPLFTALSTYFGYGLLMLIGHIRDFIDRILGHKSVTTEPGFAPIVNDFEDFYTRRLYHRISDAWNRPIASCPGSLIELMERKRVGYENVLTGTTKTCFNLGSYNYLGFGDPNSPTKPIVLDALDRYGVATGSNRTALGTTELHAQLEELVARYVGKEDAMIFGMGFGTNSTGVPALIGKGGLIISDSMNHSSIAIGARSSGAVIKVFRHNDMKHLEAVIRRAIIDGQPLSHRPWTKILIMVEGIYSMEGEMCPLKEIVALKQKYKCYLYVDEAHSIGAIGRTGRGICEYTGVNPADVDILMGTFTKSFGAVGGYIAGDRPVIEYLRQNSAGSVYSASISPPACQQVIEAIKIIIGEDGTNIGQTKLTSLRDNANYFRDAMRAMGCHVLGDVDSPVVPVMLYLPAKISAFSRECLKRNLAVVVVGFPASPLLLSRTRFCISAGHTREQLQAALKQIEEVCDVLQLKYAKAWF